MRVDHLSRVAGMALWLAAFAGVAPAVAQPGGQPAPRRDGHRLVRMHIASTAQMQTMLALGTQPLNCVIGLGEQDFSVSPAALRQMQALGLSMRVLHDNVQALIDADLARMRGAGPANPANPGDDGGIAGPATWFADYKTYPQVSAYMDTLVALQPSLAMKFSAGTSLEGRTLHGLRITSNVGGPPDPNKPAVLFTGCQHAREWAAVMTAMYVADTLVRDYGSDSRITALLDQAEVFIIPVVNPDGFEFTYAVGGDRLWRKNRRVNGGGVFGVDLNRNWAVDWSGPNSTSINPASDVFVGSAAFSEPETAAVRDFIIAHPRLVANIDFHSYSQLVLQPWAWTNAENADHDVIDAIGTAMNKSIADVHSAFYQNGWGGSLLYLASGVLPDWTYGIRGMLGYTIEVRDRGASGFTLPAVQILPTGEENFQAALTLAERAIGGAEFIFPNGVPPSITSGAVTPVRVDIRPTPQSVLNPASAKLRWRVGSSGAFAASPMSVVGTNQYQATLPALACGQKLECYYEIANAAAVILTSPGDAPASLHSAIALRDALTYDFQATAGWSVSVSGAAAGGWQRGVPANDVNWAYDPRADADGSGACWVTANALGASDVDNGSVLLTSPVIDVPALLGAGEGAGIAYAWYLHTVSPVAGDDLRVQISVTGAAGPFTTLHTHTQSGTRWRRGFISAGQLAAAGVTPTSASVLRFVAIDGNPQSIVEAAIDDVRIVADCSSGTCPADVNHDRAIDVNDLLAVINAWGACAATPCAADMAPPSMTPPGFGDGQVDINDLLTVINAWGPCP